MTTNLSDRQDCFNSRKNRHCISHFSKVSGDNEIKYPCNTELQIRNRLVGLIFLYAWSMYVCGDKHVFGSSYIRWVPGV